MRGLVTEDDLEDKVLAWAQARGILPFKLNLQGNTGWPDRLWLFSYPAIAFIEFKRPGKGPVLERNQPARVEELQRRGYPVGVFDDYDKAIAFLETEVLSKRRSEADGVASVPGSFYEARPWQDFRCPHGFKDPTGCRVCEEDFGYLPNPADV